MQLTRRELLGLAAGSALAFGAKDLIQLEEALASATSPPVIWLQGASCTGCSISLLNSTNPTIDQVLLNTVSMKYHPNLSSAAGDLAISSIVDTAALQAGKFILVVEGAIPTAASGHYCTIGRRNGAEWTIAAAVAELAPKAKRVIAVGTCAGYGGIAKPSAHTGVVSVRQHLSGKTPAPVINLPGCPAHPNTILGTIVTVLTQPSITLDSEGRPTAYYAKPIHERCPRKEAGEVKRAGVYGCYKPIKCSGPTTKTDCPARKWNNGMNWCVGVNSPCIGCSSSAFPRSPLYAYPNVSL